MTRAIVLFGHGSRDPLWRAPMDAVAARIAQRSPAVVVRCAFLELAQPDLGTSVRDLVAAGTTQVTIVPMFLGAGRHVREDLPVLVEALRRDHPALDIALMAPVGEHPLVLDLLSEIACPR
ncbi:sirohydrochlorin chelatase [Caenimonas sp. SL110]|uniref:sirohydrochlorin chelatase n=1 Tax=Caenimonas sp. SL110 TaxID=1450524 RepID=UPI0006547B53|nr:CbiX/SirB N-terminal domain-containing protein [Caenimonas sp. SL110]